MNLPRADLYAPSVQAEIKPLSWDSKSKVRIPTVEEYAAASKDFNSAEFCQVISGLYEASKQEIANFGDIVQKSTEELKELEKEYLNALSSAAKTYSEKTFWDTLSHIAQYIFNTVAMIFGVAMVSTGALTFVGGMLIAGGFLGFTNQAFIDLGGWNWLSKQMAQDVENQKKIEEYLSVAIGIFCTIIQAIAAGYLLYGPVAFASGSTAMWLQRAGVYYQALRTITEGIMRFEQAKIRSMSIKDQAAMNRKQEMQFLLITHMETHQKVLENALSVVARLVKDSHIVLQRQASLLYGR